MAVKNLVLTESELVTIMAVCYQAGQDRNWPIALGTDAERMVLGAVIIAHRLGQSHEALRPKLTDSIQAGIDRQQELVTFVEQVKRNPFAFSLAMLLDIKPEDVAVKEDRALMGDSKTG